MAERPTNPKQPAGDEAGRGQDAQPVRGGEAVDETQPAEEYGERHATGKAIERGGKTEGHVPGAAESSD